MAEYRFLEHQGQPWIWLPAWPPQDPDAPQNRVLPAVATLFTATTRMHCKLIYFIITPRTDSNEYPAPEGGKTHFAGYQRPVACLHDHQPAVDGWLGQRCCHGTGQKRYGDRPLAGMF